MDCPCEAALREYLEMPLASMSHAKLACSGMRIAHSTK
jgi:hypothetical protein